MATIIGTSNPETMTGTSKSDSISAGAGDDTVYAGDGNDTVRGGSGSDVIYAGDGNDKLYGEDGNDAIFAGDGNDTVDAGSGDDTIAGESGNDTINAGDGNDVIDGGADNDTINAGLGDDRVMLSTGQDVIDASLGNDTLDGSNIASGVNINLVLGAVTGGARAVAAGFENVIGTKSADIITGDNGNNILDGNGGNDKIYGGLGDDTLISGDGQGQYYGEAGNDTLVWTVGTAGSQVFDGGLGTDTLRIALSSSQINSAVIAELNAYSAFIADPANAGKAYQFSAIGQLLVQGNEGLSLVVDGAQTTVAAITNTAPEIGVSSASQLTVAHNGTVASAVAASDANGDQLTYSIVGDAAHGQVTLDAATGEYVYAAGNYKGADSFTVRVSDGRGGYADHAVSVEITNAAPEVLAASDTALSVVHGHSVAGHIAAQDADGDAYTFTIATGPQHGTLVFTDESGSYVYKADDYVGYDSFTIRVADGLGGFADHVVQVNETNTGPAIDAAGTTGFFSALYGTSTSGLVSAIDADGDQVTFTLKSGPANGSVAVSADGQFTFSAQDYAGADSFVVTASDGHGGSVDHRVEFGVIGTLDATTAGAAVNVNLGTGAATGVDQSKMPWAINIAGSNFNDILYGDARDNILSGGAGKDELHGAAGHDRVEGGIGDDKLFGEDGNDVLDAGDGNDSLNGGAHNDEMRGGAGNDGFFGGGGNDKVWGDAGNDRIYGDGGDDIIRGGSGNDTMTGAGFNNGGAKGANTYLWDRPDVLNADGSKAGLDHITDFGVGDRMDFTGLVSNQAAGIHDAVRITDTAAGLVVSVDTGGTGGFVDVVILDNVHGLTIDDLAHQGAITV